MKYVPYLGDNRLSHKIIYDKRRYSKCIYCGKTAETREHIPSKVFLAEPYPDNLGIVPACFECNQSFSKDELFLSLLIEILKNRYSDGTHKFDEGTKGRIHYNKTLVKLIKNVIENNNLDQFEQPISRIIFKLAVGHSVFELSEGFCIKSGEINYSFSSSLPEEEIEEFTLPFNIGEEPLPEIGSRVFDRVMVIEMGMISVLYQEQTLRHELILLDWVDVQDAKYTYTCYKFGDKIIVKIIISDFLYAKVVINTKKNIDTEK